MKNRSMHVRAPAWFTRAIAAGGKPYSSGHESHWSVVSPDGKKVITSTDASPRHLSRLVGYTAAGYFEASKEIPEVLTGKAIAWLCPPARDAHGTRSARKNPAGLTFNQQYGEGRVGILARVAALRREGKVREAHALLAQMPKHRAPIPNHRGAKPRGVKRHNPLYTPDGFIDPDRYIIGHGLPKELRGTVPNVDPGGTDLSIWTWTTAGKLYGIAFQAKSTTPLWYHQFRSEEQLAEHVQRSIQSRRGSLERKEETVAKRRAFAPTVQPGDIYYTSGGYDETHVSFYEVVKVSGKSAEVRKVASRVVSSEAGSDYVAAVPGRFIGPAKRVVLTESGFKVDRYKHASAWDGRPKYETAVGWGH